MEITAEICCGGFDDALQAEKGGAKRIELNSGLYLGGLTPGVGTLKLTKERTSLAVIAMVRPRGGGFFYSDAEYEAMLRDAEELLLAGADGLAFGFLNEDRTIDTDRTREMADLVHSFGKTAVFHRAFDCTGALDGEAEKLIASGIDRVLTSGGKRTAGEGRETLRHLEETFGNQIEILAGGGINAANVESLVRAAGVRQIHSSCKGWRTDRTAQNGEVSYGYADGTYSRMFDAVSREKTEKLLSAIARL